PASGEETVQQIGGRGGKKDCERQPFVGYDEPADGDSDTLPNQRRHQQRHEEDARDRQGIGNIHLRRNPPVTMLLRMLDVVFWMLADRRAGARRSRSWEHAGLHYAVTEDEALGIHGPAFNKMRSP